MAIGIIFVAVFLFSAIAGCWLDMQTLSKLKRYNPRFSSRAYVETNLIWLKRRAAVRALLGRDTVIFMEHHTLLFPLIELAFASSVAIAYYHYGWTWDLLRIAIFLMIGIPLACVSWQEKPDCTAPSEWTHPGIIIGLIVSFLPGSLKPASSLAGAIVSYTILNGVAKGYEKLKGEEGMGYGAVLTGTLAGAFCGLGGSLLTILSGSLIGTLVGLGAIWLYRLPTNYPLPFVSFLVIGGMISGIWGPKVVSWYISLLVSSHSGGTWEKLVHYLSPYF